MKKRWEAVLRFALWLIVWEIFSNLVKDKIPFAGPVMTVAALAEAAVHKEFYVAVWTTFSGIALGFFVAMVIGTLLGYLAYFHEKVDYMITPVIGFFRYIPMITFTILAIMWSKASALAFEVSIFLSMPVIYRHTLTGLKNSDQHYLNRVRAIKMPPVKKFIYLYQPVKMAEYIPGCHRALNMCWKSGIIAQFLGNSVNSIGSMLYQAQTDADVAGIFAWTIVIVGLSVAFEQIVIRLLSTDRYNAGRVNVEDVFEELESEEISL
ncbi:MAG: ABC transporter permease subunit [Alistipes sp.]|nr:ABC transporter permease subunit [Alistipes sp.]